MKKAISLLLILGLVISIVAMITLQGSAVTSDISQTAEVSDPVGLYCSTNPGGNCGKKANISIDGSISDWDSSMLIAQGVCNDDPRVYMNSSMHEIPLDTYALYAAWDDNNLYLMWEMKNVQDVVAPNDNFPLNPDNYQLFNDYGHNFPQFLVFNTGKRTAGNGLANDGQTVWQSGITWEDGIDTFIATSNQVKYANGPYLYKTNDSGVFQYNNTIRKDIVFAGGAGSISEKCMGIFGAYGKSHNRVPGDIIDESADWVDYYTSFTRTETRTKKDKVTGETTITTEEKTYSHKKSMDFFFEVSIPFTALDIDREYLETNGIGVMHVETYGTSGMNSLPVDLSMSDQADLSYSVDPSSSREKEDEDNITVPLARIGVCSEPGPIPTTPTKPTETEETPTETKPTETEIAPTETEPTETEVAPTETEPTEVIGENLYGDVNLDKRIDVLDVTVLQQALAGQKTLDEDQKKAATFVPNETQPSVNGATGIQMYLANKISSTNAKIGQKF